MSVQGLIFIMQKRVRLIAACAVGLGLMALVGMYFVTPTYQAEADAAIVKSAVEVNFDPRFKTVSEANSTQLAIDQAARRKALATIAASDDLAMLVAPQLGAQWTDTERTPAELGRAITARSDGDLIRITAKANSAEKAAFLANAWTQAYIKRVNEIYTDTPLSLAEMQAQVEAAKQVYAQQEAALVAYLGNNPQNQLSRTLTEKQQVLNDSLATSNKLNRLLADAQSLRERLSSAETTAGVGDELAHLILEANGFSAATGLPPSIPSNDTNPTTPLQLQLQLDQLKLDTTPAQQLHELDALIAALSARRQRLVAEDSTQLLQDVNQLQAQLEQENSKKQQLTQARDLAWSTYATLSNKAAEIRVAQQAQGTVVRMASAALEPQDPVQPSWLLFGALATVAGLVLGIAFAVILEYVNPKTSLRSGDDDTRIRTRAPASD